MEINWLEWLGYLASFLVLISLLMSSVIKLRWINLVGSGLFSLYGFLLGSLPVGFMNLGTALINIYYLNKIYRSKEHLKFISIKGNSEYLKYFLEFYQRDIERKFKLPQLGEDSDVSFFVLRNMIPAGIFMASRYDEKTLKVELDFVTPEYRDFKIGHYIYETRKDYFLEKGYSRWICLPLSERFNSYLKKMGFKETVENNQAVFVKTIEKSGRGE